MLTTSKSMTYEEVNMPLLLEPAGKDYLWGGQRLTREFGKLPEVKPLAETWECSTHPDGLSLIAQGPLQGQPLAAYLRAFPQALGRHAGKADGLPVLVKLIDAAKDLSIQVHPDDTYALAHEGQAGKTELWYVLDAQPGAELIYGFSHDISEQQLRQAVTEGSIGKHLQRLLVHQDDVFYVRPGTIHAIGAGVLLAEIQQCSNVTYRVYDYDRVDKDGKKRPLHVEAALEVLDRKASPQVRQQLRLLRYVPGAAVESLCQCAYFHVHRVLVSESFSWEPAVGSFEILLMLEGELLLQSRSTWGAVHTLRIKKGSCVFLPAGVGTLTLNGKGQLLKISC